MKVTKFVHSCLLIEDSGKKVLIDPGMYSINGLKTSLRDISSLDYLLITHEHFDHMDVSLVKEIIDALKPQKVISTQSVHDILGKESIDVETRSDEYIQIEAVQHESMIPLGEPPQNVLFHIANILTHPGDSHTFRQTKDILALPIQAPWGSMVTAIRLALDLKPKKIIPIHDWHWRTEARTQQYDRLEEFFQKHNIQFIKPLESSPFIL